MTTNRWLLLGLVLVVALVIAAGRLLWTGEEGADSVAPVAQAPLRPIGDTRLPVLPPAGEVPPPLPLPTQDSPITPIPESTVDAAESMARAMEHGDPQAPRVVRDAPREAPTAAELADPKAYQQYEARQNQRLYSQYIKAADTEIPRLQADIERARAAGLPPEQIAEGEEKLRRIQAMRDQLQADNPGLR